ncbi:hypothetical protein L3556_07665 [Candidatus Synechococcus calcipolaris G9]|uniref:CopG family transcriptional regulator n=1 Tax=Candidatus Synechococcus calcipolaris G9 TaxID=1497997 RepID=A0ABT6EYD6_9SYNE|nr:hypothetical protein [Candidatus Synechococcus calcipolaris]MDG2990806.1 hypothetical protein [Candidatus Synechococcus calcipolaris G9]
MSKKVSITLDDETLKFVDSCSKNRSSFINHILLQEQQRVLMEDLEKSYQDQANDPDFQKEISTWDIVVSDGLDA